jgi:EpsI family protein
MIARLYTLSACFAVTALALLHWTRGEATPARLSFTTFPAQISDWSGSRAPEFDAEVIGVLGVTEYVNRYYSRGDQIVHLYIGYYGSQREGSSIHSPMNCLPGAGWVPVSTARVAVPISSDPGSGTADVNRVIIQKGLEKDLVLYWYQSHGRIIPSEYWSKWFLVVDSMRLHRTDAALVRVIAPYRDRDPAPERVAEATAGDFVRTMIPLLNRFLPL